MNPLTPEAIVGLLELAKVGTVGTLVAGGVIYLVVMRRNAPEKTPIDHLRDEVSASHKEVTEVRADLALFRLEAHGRLSAIEAQMKGLVK